jgi:hypothetical protein
MPVHTRKLLAIAGGLVFCGMWISVIVAFFWFLHANVVVTETQSILSGDIESFSRLFRRFAALFIISIIPAYWAYAGAVGVIEDYRDYKKITKNTVARRVES